MATAVLEPPATPGELRARAAGLTAEVEAQLRVPAGERSGGGLVDATGGAAGLDAERHARGVADRAAFFAGLRRDVASLARSPAWRAHDLTTELLLLVGDLGDAIDADPDGEDPRWHVREALQRTRVVLAAMVRQLEHDALDQPAEAARHVAVALADVEVSAVARLLATTSRMVANYRRGAVGQLRRNPNRVTLVAQLVAELQASMTPRGVLLWFDAPMPALGDRTPRALLDEDPVAHRPTLIALARGGRAQLDRGGAARADLEHAA